MWKMLNSNQMCEQFSYKEVSYREVLLYLDSKYKFLIEVRYKEILCRLMMLLLKQRQLCNV